MKINVFFESRCFECSTVLAAELNLGAAAANKTGSHGPRLFSEARLRRHSKFQSGKKIARL
jgi:hypothetical protein